MVSTIVHASHPHQRLTASCSAKDAGSCFIASAFAATLIAVDALPLAAGIVEIVGGAGIELDGTAIANTTGIQFNPARSLNVADSVIRNFTGSGISIEPTGGPNPASMR